MTAAQLQTLSTELKTDPLARGYAAMLDDVAAARVAVVDRPGDGSVSAVLNYLLVNKSRTNTGTDVTATSMLGRLLVVSATAIGTDPFGASPATPITLDLKCSALAFLEVCRNPNIRSLPYQTATLQQLLTDMVTAHVMKSNDTTAIVALSNNLQSRAAELGIPTPTTSNVADARKLP